MLTALLALALTVNSMAALVTTPPIIADPIDNSRQSSIEINPFLFVKGPFVYQVLTGSTGALEIFKSTNRGTNSANLDQGNSPPLHNGSFVCWSDPNETKIHIAYNNDLSITMGVIDFDTSNDKYGTNWVSAVNGVFTHGCGVFYDATTSTHFVTYAAPGTSLLKYITLTAGIFSAPISTGVTAETGAQGLFYTAFDSTARIAFLFYLESIGSQHYNCVTLTPAGSVGVPVTLATDGVEWVEATINSGTINAAWINGDSTKVKTSGAAVATAPVFAAATTITTVVAPKAVTYISITPDWTGTLTIFWCLTDLSFNPGVDEIDYSQFISAAWTAPAQFYDAITNPPAGGLPYPSQFVHTLQAVTISNGWFGMTAMETGLCTGFILVVPGIPTPTFPPPPGSAGRKPIVLAPNQFDFCLHREYRLFCNIDYNAKGCARLPKCFTVDEREWGEAG